MQTETKEEGLRPGARKQQFLCRFIEVLNTKGRSGSRQEKRCSLVPHRGCGEGEALSSAPMLLLQTSVLLGPG